MPEEDSGFMRVCMTMHAGRGGEEAVRRGPPRLGDAIPEVHQRAPRRRGEGRGVTKEGVRRQNAPVPEPRRLDAQTARDRAQLAAPGEGQLGAVSTRCTLHRTAGTSRSRPGGSRHGSWPRPTPPPTTPSRTTSSPTGKYTFIQGVFSPTWVVHRFLHGPGTNKTRSTCVYVRGVGSTRTHQWSRS